MLRACLRQIEERQWLLTQFAARADLSTTQLATLQATIQQVREWLPIGPTVKKA